MISVLSVLSLLTYDPERLIASNVLLIVANFESIKEGQNSSRRPGTRKRLIEAVLRVWSSASCSTTQQEK